MPLSDMLEGKDGNERTQMMASAVGSTADLYPRLATMQRLLEAQSFAVLTARASTAINPGTLTVLMEGSDSASRQVGDLLERSTPMLLAHLRASPMPLHLDGDAIEPIDPGEVGDDGGTIPGGIVEDIAFPVQLGAMGNGYTVFFGVRKRIDADMLIDLHRKSVVVMREALKLEFNSLAALESLNEREIECLQLVGDGMKSEAIGEKLNLSVHTVNAYLGTATTKLDAVNRIQAIAKGIRLGLIG